MHIILFGNDIGLLSIFSDNLIKRSPTLMYLLKFFLITHIFLMIVACEVQEKTSPVENKHQAVFVPVKSHDRVKSVPRQAKPVLDLSIDSIINKDKTNSDALSINNNVHVEENSALFNTLNKKHAESKLNLSGEFLTDKNADDETSYIKSVDGIQIDIQGNFK